MTRRPASISPEVIQQLLGAIGTEPPLQSDEEVTEYDWGVPRRFAPRQMERLAEFGRQVAAKISDGLGEMLRTDVPLVFGAMAERYGADVLSGLADPPALHLPLTRGGEPVGLVSLLGEAALTWLGVLLGGAPDSPDEVRKLSSVDMELLADLARVIGEAVSAVSANRGIAALGVHAEADTASGVLSGMASGEFCRFSLSPAAAEQEEPDEEDAGDEQTDAEAQGDESSQAEAPASPAVEVFLLSDLAAELAGGGGHPGKADSGSGQGPAAWMRDHVEEGVVAVTAVLGAAELSMGEILSLESGDVFVLPIQAGAGSVLRVQGKSIAAGTPVQSEGQYALCITSLLDESASTAPAEATERNDANG